MIETLEQSAVRQGLNTLDLMRDVKLRQVVPAVGEPEPTRIDSVPTNIDLKEATREFQRSLIERSLADDDRNWSAASRFLGMHLSHFHHPAVRMGLK